MVPRKPGKKFMRTHLSRKKLDMVGHACHFSYNRKCQIGGSLSRLAWVKKDETLFPK
jgi:hypothetical protein